MKIVSFTLLLLVGTSLLAHTLADCSAIQRTPSASRAAAPSDSAPTDQSADNHLDAHSNCNNDCQVRITLPSMTVLEHSNQIFLSIRFSFPRASLPLADPPPRLIFG